MVCAITRYPLFSLLMNIFLPESGNVSCRHSCIDAKWLTGVLAEWWR
jgi:hypothetical protein